MKKKIQPSVSINQKTEKKRAIRSYYYNLTPNKPLMTGPEPIYYNGKEILTQVANWIEEGLLEYADKKRMSEWLSKQRSNSAEVRNLFRHSAKVIENFENPILSSEDIRLRSRKTFNDGIYHAKQCRYSFTPSWTRKGNLSSKTYYKTKKGVSQRVINLNDSLHSTSLTDGATLSDAKVPQIYEPNNDIAENNIPRFRSSIAPEVREEMETIKADAIVNGAYMKAPNGNPTDLTEEQWAMVLTSPATQGLWL